MKEILHKRRRLRVNFTKSEQLYQEALEHIVGGVNSPSRSYKAVGGGAPVVMERAQGHIFGM